MAKVRYQMFLDESQKEALEKLRYDTKVPVAEIIRKAIDNFLVEIKKKKTVPIEDIITERLLSVSGICKGGPRDLSDKHDRYLYEASIK